MNEPKKENQNKDMKKTIFEELKIIHSRKKTTRNS
jgi:hypothetical protein